MTRSLYDLSRYVYQLGPIGMPVVMGIDNVMAGDSLSLKLTGSLRLAPLRRSLALDLKLMTATFFVPWRFIYGYDVWRKFITADDMAAVLPENPLSGTGVLRVADSILTGTAGWKKEFAAAGNPRHLLGGFSQFRYVVALYHIWEWFFRDPHDHSRSILPVLTNRVNAANASLGVATFAQTKSILGKAYALWNVLFNTNNVKAPTNGLWSELPHYMNLVGLPSCKLMSPRTVFPPRTSTFFNDRLTPTGVVNASTINLPELEEASEMLTRARRRQLYGARYTDIMRQTFGVNVEDETDYRPELLAISHSSSSGYDVDGTDSASLGTNSGKAYAAFNHRMGRKFFPEHGCVITLALCRFPTITFNQKPYLHDAATPSYLDFAGPASVVATQPPRDVKINELEEVTQDSVLGSWPSGHQWRIAHDVVHPQFAKLQGYPFLNAGAARGPSLAEGGFPVPTRESMVYDSPFHYEAMFQTMQLGPWNAACVYNAMRYSDIPQPEESYFAGASF